VSFYIFQIQLFLKNKFISKLIWVLNNFLTMECYRKLCNKFYWKKLDPNTISYRTRFWMILISVLTATFLAFFYDPSDPTHSFTAGCIVIITALSVRHSCRRLFTLLQFYSKNTVHNINVFSDSILNSVNISLYRSQKSYLRTSSLLI